MRISDWSSDVCSSDLAGHPAQRLRGCGEVELGDARKEQEDDIGRAVGHADGPSLAWITQARGSHRSRSPMELHLQRQSRDDIILRSEEHTSELQSLMRISYAVFCLNKKTS